MPKYVVTVLEITADPSGAPIYNTEVFKQSVETVDLAKVFAAVNYKKRERKKRAEKPV